MVVKFHFMCPIKCNSHPQEAAWTHSNEVLYMERPTLSRN